MVAKGKMLCSKYHLCGDYKLDTKCKHGAIHEEILGVCNYHFCRGVSDWVHCIVEEEGGEEYICDIASECNNSDCFHRVIHHHQRSCDDPTCSVKEGVIVGCVPVDFLKKPEEKELYVCEYRSSCFKGESCSVAKPHVKVPLCDEYYCPDRMAGVVCSPLSKVEEKENKEKNSMSFIAREQLEENPNFKKGSMEDLSVVDCELWVELLLSRSVTRATEEKVNSDIDDAIKYLEILRIKLVEEINGK